jgi:hypothetical protein
MYKHHLYLDTCINNTHIKDHIELASNYKKGEFKFSDQIINGEMTTKIEFIPELNENDRKLKENWDKLTPFDQNRLIKKGVIKEGDIKRNCVIKVKYKY